MLPLISQRILWLISPVLLIGIVNGFYKDILHDSMPLFFWLADTTHFLLLPITILVYLYYQYQIKPVDYGFKIKAVFKHPVEWVVWIVLSSIIFYYGYTLLSQFFLWLLDGKASNFAYTDTMPEPVVKRLLTTVYFAATAAFVEEIFNRALPWLALSKLGESLKIKVIYVLATALIFGLLHWENGIHELWATGVFGIITAILYLYLKTIWPLVIGHFVTDCIVFW